MFPNTDLMPPNHSQDKNKYPAKECREFMKEISNAGFGTVEELNKEGSYRKTYTFRKRPYEALGDSQHETLKKLHLNYEITMPRSIHQAVTLSYKLQDLAMILISLSIFKAQLQNKHSFMAINRYRLLY